MRRELLLVVFSTVLTLVGAELVLRHYFPQRTVQQFLKDQPAMYRSSEALFTELLPNFQGVLREAEFDTSIRVNSLGYRQDEFDPHKSTQRRILVIGDSFTFGYGVEEPDTYPRVLERELNKDGNGNVSLPIEVVNAGVPTWWTDAYYLYLKERGLALEPDLILLGLFMGNDIDARDARRAIWPQVDADGLPLQTSTVHVRVENGHLVRVKRRARWRIPILRNSHVFQLLYTARRNLRRVQRPRIQSLSLYQSVYTQQTNTLIEKVKKLIVAMASLSRQRGAQFAVVMLPERQQISAISPVAYGN
jgi:lysophospholipase L1-like esterase